MILRSIRVQGWRCYADPVTVGPFADGINVIHAPNATGKSSLLEAVVRGFFDGHRVGGRDVETMRPWGRDLAPEVTLEFTQDGTDYRLRKRFLDNPCSELFRREGGKFVRLSEGEKSDEFVRALFSGSSPGRGLSKPAHWGLAQVLLIPQGRLELSDLSGDLVRDIQESLGVHVSGPGASPLEQRIEEAYLRLFTPTGKLRTGRDAPRIVGLRSRAEELQAQRHVLLEALEAFERVSRRVEDFRAVRAQARRDEEGLTARVEKVREQARAYARLEADRDLKREQLKAAAATHAELKQRVDGIEGARKEQAEARRELDRLRADIAFSAREVERLNALAEKAGADLEEVRKGRQGVETAEREAEDALRFTQARKNLTERERVLDKIRETAQELETRKKDLGRVVAPDEKTLKAMRKALAARSEAQVRLDAALITLEIVPEEDTALEVLSAEETGRRQVAAGLPVRVKGSPEVHVNLEGMARIRARGPAGTVEELREAVTRAGRKLEALTAGFGTAEIDELEARSERSRLLLQQVSDARTRLDTLLGGSTVEEMEQARRKNRQAAEEILAAHPEWSGDPPDADLLRDRARTVKQTFIARVDEAELRKDKAATAFQAATVTRAGVQARHEEAVRRERSLSEKLEAMQKDGLDDRERAAHLKEASLTWEAARNTLQDLEAGLARYPEDPRVVLEGLERQTAAVRQQASSALEQQRKEEGRLEHLAAEGPYSALARVEEELAGIRAQVEDETLRTEAIQLLRNTVLACKTRVLTDLRQPVELAATRLLHRIAGTRLGPVQLAERFQPQGVRPRTASGEVNVAELSGGEKEQVHLAVRLALAEVLAGERRRFVVLDDVLTATDTGRLARILSILEEEAGRLQLFLLSCHPERYRALSGAAFFDLEEIRAGA